MKNLMKYLKQRLKAAVLFFAKNKTIWYNYIEEKNIEYIRRKYGKVIF